MRFVGNTGARGTEEKVAEFVLEADGRQRLQTPQLLHFSQWLRKRFSAPPQLQGSVVHADRDHCDIKQLGPSQEARPGGCSVRDAGGCGTLQNVQLSALLCYLVVSGKWVCAARQRIVATPTPWMRSGSILKFSCCLLFTAIVPLFPAYLQDREVVSCSMQMLWYVLKRVSWEERKILMLFILKEMFISLMVKKLFSNNGKQGKNKGM